MTNEILSNYILETMAAESKNFNDNTRIEMDLGIYGDDANEFITAFGRNFNVDVSNFLIDDYFRGEGIIIFEAIFRYIFQIKVKRKILKAKHLVKAM